MRLNDAQASRILKSVDVFGSLRVLVLNNYGIDDLSEDEYCNNLYCVDDNNVVIWQVNSPKSRHGSDAFTYVKISDGKIIAKKESGTKYLVDEKTGVATEIGFEK